MKQAQFNEIVNETVTSIHKLLTVKGGEYAGSDDRLSNFKRGATLTGCTPLQVAFIYASKHYDAISTYIKKAALVQEQVLSEPIDGRLDDLINYCLLIKALIKEEQAAESFEVMHKLLDEALPGGTGVSTGLDTYHADKRAEDSAMVSSLVQSGTLIPIVEEGVLLRFEVAPEAVEFSYHKE